ncbi:MAG: hypothetical protein GX241_01015 [Ruminococcaceae bacterium]|nr:hypothetical protein [Oscillospiraceae bacterium]
MKKFLLNFVTKIERINYALIILAWIAGAVFAILGNPWVTIILITLHAMELPIGIKAGLKGGEALVYSIVMCLIFGFVWWLPLKVKTGQIELD